MEQGNNDLWNNNLGVNQDGNTQISQATSSELHATINTITIEKPTIENLKEELKEWNSSRKLDISATPKTPAIQYDPTKKVLSIIWRTIHEDSEKRWNQIRNILNNSPSWFLEIVDINLEYFNTSWAKDLFDVFKLLEKIKNGNDPIKVNWYYEEEDEYMREAGKDYGSMFNLEWKNTVSEEN